MKTATIEKTTVEKMGELFEGAFRTLPLWSMIPSGETFLLVQNPGLVAAYSANLTEDEGIELATLLLGFFAPLGGDYHSLKEGTDMGALTDNFIEVVKEEAGAAREEELPDDAPFPFQAENRWLWGVVNAIATGNNEFGSTATAIELRNLAVKAQNAGGPPEEVEAATNEGLDKALVDLAEAVDAAPDPDPEEKEEVEPEPAEPKGVVHPRICPKTSIGRDSVGDLEVRVDWCPGYYGHLSPKWAEDFAYDLRTSAAVIREAWSLQAETAAAISPLPPGV